MKFTLSGIKMAGGDETPRFEANVLLDGKKVGIAYNEGSGGCNGYSFRDHDHRKAFTEFCIAWGTANEKDLTEITDAWVYAAMDELEFRKRLVRKSKTKTLFRLKGDAPDVWQSYARPFSEEMKRYVTEKHGDQLETIFDPAVQS